MKRLLAILVVATMLVSLVAMTPVLSAATADWVHPSAQGTAVIDGEKDAAYDAAEVLVFDQCGTSNGSGAVLDYPAAHVYVINDDDFIYVYFDVHDTDLDNTATNNYEQDSVEIFYMKDNAKTQWRVHYDEVIDADSGDPAVLGDNVAVNVYPDGSGYGVEAKLPITDVLNNQCEILLQVDWCSGGKRDATVYATGHPEGDDGWQRNNRQTEYDCWMTLQLVGEFEDTRVDPVPEAQVIDAKNYQSIVSRKFDTQLFAQDQITWGWIGMGIGESVNFGDTDVALEWTGLAGTVAADALNADNTNNFTTAPKFAIQVSDGAMVDGEKGEYGMSYTDVTVKAEGYEDVVIPGEVKESIKLTAANADWGMSGNAWEIILGGPIMEALGLSIEDFCTAYMPAVTDVTLTMSYNTYNLNTKEVVDEFVAGLEALEQAYIEESLGEYTTRVNDALAAAQAANGDIAAIEAALDDATKAANRANKEVEGSGYTGAAVEHVKGLKATVEEIQSILDEAKAAAAPAEPDPAENEPSEPTTAPSSNSGSGSTGIVVGIIVVVVVVIVVVAAIVLGKKKK